jgi:hypothetical protein
MVAFFHQEKIEVAKKCFPLQSGLERLVQK